MGTYLRGLFLSTLYFWFYIGFCQEGLPVYFEYLSDNYYIIHPSAAGLGYAAKARVTARKQWFDVDKSPQLMTASLNARLGEFSGLGTVFMSDTNGNYSENGIYVSYAHHLKLSAPYQDFHQLSFGLSVALFNRNLNERTLKNLYYDPIISNQANSFLYANVDLGLSYNLFDYYLHFTAKNIFLSPRYIYGSTETLNTRSYVLNTGYTFSLRNVGLEPSILYMYEDYLKQNTLDTNLKLYTKNLKNAELWGGLSARWSFGKAFNNNVYLSPFVGVNFKDLMIGYTYSQSFSSSASIGGNYHQFSLGYTFLKSKVPYKCYCPSVNN